MALGKSFTPTHYEQQYDVNLKWLLGKMLHTKPITAIQ
jgi:hypothetical protein